MGCHPRLNKVSGKTAVDLMGPEFLSHYMSSTPPSCWNDCAAAAEASPRAPAPPYRTALLTASGDATEHQAVHVRSRTAWTPHLMCVDFRWCQEYDTVGSCSFVSSFLPVTIFFFNAAYWPCFYRKGNTVTFLLGAKPLEFLSFAAFLTMQPERWELAHGKPGRSAL